MNTTAQPMTADRESVMASIIITAVEGGVNYWADVDDYTWYADWLDDGNSGPAANGGDNAYAILRDREEGTTHEVTLEIVADAVERIAAGEAFSYLSDGVRSVATAINAYNEPVMGLDAMVADQIVQAAVFGEVVYG